MTIKKIEQWLDQMGLAKYYKLPIMEKIGSKVGYPSSVVFLVLTIFSGVILLISGLLNFILNFMVFFFPAYSTFKSFEKDDTKKHERMLIFWVCFGLLHLMEHVFHIFPVFKLIKNILTMYLYMNEYWGAEFVYHYLLKHPIQIIIKEIDKLALCIKESVNPREFQTKKTE